MKVVALAGGVGGAKLAHGLAQVLHPGDLTIIVNTGDDFEHLGLKICPDLDTVCYTLAGLANPITGWGCENETWNAMEHLALLGGPNWFRLGDKDLGTHLERTRRLREGELLSQVTRGFCDAWGIEPEILPMSDDLVQTIVFSDQGDLSFQEYFVYQQCQPKVRGFFFAGSQTAVPAPGVISAIRDANLVVICPSNPWVSIDPILSIPGVQETLMEQKICGLKVLAVSPIIGGKAIKGPVVKMYKELDIEASAISVAKHYLSFLDVFVFDAEDNSLEGSLRDLNVTPLCLQTVMKSIDDRRRLAINILTGLETE